MEQDEDGIVEPWTIKAVLKQGGINPDDIFARKLLNAEHAKLEELNQLARLDPDALVNEYIKLRYILAYAYQICGMHDCPDAILDVLSDPENATEKQINALLPYRIPHPLQSLVGED